MNSFPTGMIWSLDTSMFLIGNILPRCGATAGDGLTVPKKQIRLFSKPGFPGVELAFDGDRATLTATLDGGRIRRRTRDFNAHKLKTSLRQVGGAVNDALAQRERVRWAAAAPVLMQAIRWTTDHASGDIVDVLE